MRDKLLTAIETLRNLYYLAQNLRGEGRVHIRQLYESAPLIPEEKIPEALENVRLDIETLK